LDPVPVNVLADDEAAPAEEQVAVAGGEAENPPLENVQQDVALNVVGPLPAWEAAANPVAAGLAEPAVVQPALPAGVAQEDFVQAATARGMIIHPHAMNVVVHEQVPVVDMDAAAVALHQRVAFTQHRNALLGPVPPGCCKSSDEKKKKQEPNDTV
jgi:hypothetical protein